MKTDLETRIANEIAANRALFKMVRAMNEAGYVAFGDEFEWAQDLGDRWIFIAKDDCLGGYTVGAFFKATATKTADYAAAPIGEFETLAEAVAKFEEFQE